MIMDFLEIEQSAYAAAHELCAAAGLKAGDVMVVGCSSSEIVGGRIGKASSPEAAEAVYRGVSRAAAEVGAYIAAQCCEHLNRAIIIEREALRRAAVGEIVNAVPQIHAGGSFATAAYAGMSDPVAVEEIRADAGLDIGSTLIGMHLKRVAVPVRLGVRSVGEAPVTAARVRPKFIGGSRAVYDEKLM